MKLTYTCYLKIFKVFFLNCRRSNFNIVLFVVSQVVRSSASTLCKLHRETRKELFHKFTCKLRLKPFHVDELCTFNSANFVSDFGSAKLF